MSGNAPTRIDRSAGAQPPPSTARQRRVLVLSAAAGFLSGTAIGFATAPGRIGLPPLFGTIGLLLGLGFAASMRLAERRRHREVLHPRVRTVAAAPARPELDVAAFETTEVDDEWMVPPGWYPDPRGTQPTRYWDGAAWTDEAAEAPVSLPWRPSSCSP